MIPLTETQYEVFERLCRFYLRLTNNPPESASIKDLGDKILPLVGSSYGTTKGSIFSPSNHQLSPNNLKKFKAEFSDTLERFSESEHSQEVKQYKKLYNTWLSEITLEKQVDTIAREKEELDIYPGLPEDYFFFLKWHPNNKTIATLNLKVSYEQKELIVEIDWNLSEKEKGYLVGSAGIDLQAKVLSVTMFNKKKTKNEIFETSPTFLIVLLPSAEIKKFDTLCGILTGTRDHQLGVLSRLVVLSKKNGLKKPTKEQIETATKFITHYRPQSWVKIPEVQRGIPIFLENHLNKSIKKSPSE